MEIYMYSNRTEDSYDAKGEYKDGKVIVKKGSKIAQVLKDNFRPYSYVVSLRNDNTVVDEKGYIKKNVEFPSASGAAQFVSGRSTDGLMAWKISRGVNLKSVLTK